MKSFKIFTRVKIFLLLLFAVAKSVAATSKIQGSIDMLENSVSSLKNSLKALRSEMLETNLIAKQACDSLIVEHSEIKEQILKMSSDISTLKEVVQTEIDGSTKIKLTVENTVVQQLELIENISELKENISDFKLKQGVMISDIGQIAKDTGLTKEAISKMILDISKLKDEVKTEIDESNKFKSGIENTTVRQLKLMENSISELKKNVSDVKLKQVTMTSDISKIENDIGVAKGEIVGIKSNIAVRMKEVEAAILQQKETVAHIAYILVSNVKSDIQPTSRIAQSASKIRSDAERECVKHSANGESCTQNPFCGFCVWDYFTHYRCNLPENLIANGCPTSEIIDLNENIEIIVENDYPKLASPIHLCPGMKRNVTVTFQNRNIPVDVYLLLEKAIPYHGIQYLHILQHFTAGVRNISTDYTIGWGLSINKAKLPFTNTTTNSFSFHNVAKLTDRIDTFIASRPKVEGKPHGRIFGSQLEGMYQIAACKTQIGWRNNSRKILVVAAGKPYYKQEDVVSGNITKPFDGLCALNATGYYGNELTQDFPSINQIVQIIKTENVNVLFAVYNHWFSKINSETTSSKYKTLADKLSPPALLFPSDSEFKNISDILIEGYRKMSSIIEIEEIQTSEDIKVSLYTRCSGEREELKTKCVDVENGTSFVVQIEMLKCPSNRSNKQQVLKIKPKGLPISAEIPIHLFCNA